MRFCLRALRVRFVARSLKYARYVFNHAPCGRQRALKAKIPDRRGVNLPVLQGGRTQKYRAYFKDDNAAKPNNSNILGALYSDCIV